GHGPVQRVTRGLPALAEVAPEVPGPLAELVEATIALDPKDRPTAAELVQRLGGLAAGGTISGMIMPDSTGPRTVVEGELRRVSGHVRRPSGAVATPVSTPGTPSTPGAPGTR